MTAGGKGRTFLTEVNRSKPLFRAGFLPRSTVAGLVLACALLFLSENAGAGPFADRGDPAAVAAVRLLEAKWVEALNDGDAAAIGAVLADDFVRPAAESGAFISKDQLLSWYRAHGAELRSRHRRIEGMTVQVDGSMAIARGRVITTDGRGRRIGRALFTDVFVERGRRWQAVSAQENPIPEAGSH